MPQHSGVHITLTTSAPQTAILRERREPVIGIDSGMPKTNVPRSPAAVMEDGTRKDVRRVQPRRDRFVAQSGTGCSGPPTSNVTGRAASDSGPDLRRARESDHRQHRTWNLSAGGSLGLIGGLRHALAHITMRNFTGPTS